MNLTHFLHDMLSPPSPSRYLPGDFGVLTASDALMFVGVQLLYASVVKTHPGTLVAACDFGWTNKQRDWAERQPCLRVIRVPDDKLVARPGRSRWVEWNRPVILSLSPFTKTFYMDADTVLLADLSAMYGHMQKQPFLVQNPICTPSNRFLYDHLPGPISHHEDFTVASGVFGWHRGRDDIIINEWLSLTSFVLGHPNGIDRFVPMADESMLRATVQKLALFDLLWPDLHWNELVRERHPTVVDALVGMRKRYPHTHVLHFWGRPKPWETYDDTLLDFDPHWGTES